MKQVLKLFNIFSLIIPVLLIFYVYYKSEYYYSGELRDYYWKYYLILLIAEIFFIILFFLNKIIKIYFFIVFVSLIFSLYAFEFFILYSNGINLLTDYKKYYFKPPRMYINEKNLFLLSYTPNKNYISSRENWYFASFLADRHGFNNPDNQWDENNTDIILIGDSFVEGVGVNRPHDIASVLRSLNHNVLSLGLSNNGPLKNLAIAKEYLGSNHKKIFYIHYEGNDFEDLKDELNNNFLKKYYDKNFKQNLYNNKFYLKPTSLLKGYFKIYYSRKLILSYLKLFEKEITKKNINKENLRDFEEVLIKINEFIKKNNSELYFVYLPEKSRYTDNNFYENFDQTIEVVRKLNIPIIDVKKKFSNDSDVLNFYAKFGGHYSILGYKEVAKSIDRFLKKNPSR